MTALLKGKGKRLDNVNQTHLVLASGKLGLQPKDVKVAVGSINR